MLGGLFGAGAPPALLLFAFFASRPDLQLSPALLRSSGVAAFCLESKVSFDAAVFCRVRVAAIGRLACVVVDIDAILCACLYCYARRASELFWERFHASSLPGLTESALLRSVVEILCHLHHHRGCGSDSRFSPLSLAQAQPGQIPENDAGVTVGMWRLFPVHSRIAQDVFVK